MSNNNNNNTNTVSNISHGIFDDRGRECGHMVTTKAHPAGGWSVVVQPTRGGEKFGAAQYPTRCLTPAGIMVAVAKKVAAAKARLAKKFGAPTEAVTIAPEPTVTKADILDAPGAKFIETTDVGVKLHLAHGWTDANGATVLTHTTLAGLARMLQGCTAA